MPWVCPIHIIPEPLFSQVGDAEAACIDSDRADRWLWVNVRPHTWGIMHAKALLLRTPRGLRVVISGSGLGSSRHSHASTLWLTLWVPRVSSRTWYKDRRK